MKGSSPVFKKFIEESLQNYEQSTVNRDNDAKENNVSTNKTDCDYYMSRLNQLLNRNKQVNDRYGIDNVMGAVDAKTTVQNNNVVSAERTEREVSLYLLLFCYCLRLGPIDLIPFFYILSSLVISLNVR